MNWFEEKERVISKTVKEYEYALYMLKKNNIEEALNYLLLAAEPHNDEERYNWGVIYYNGIGVEKNYSKAIKWFELAAEKNYASAERALGWMFFKGEGVEKNEGKAMELLARAINHGCEDAGIKYIVGQGLLYGIHVEKDIDKGLYFLRDAANRKFDDNCRAAQRLLGELYFEGEYVDRDLKEAEKWLTMALENGENVTDLLEKVTSEL